MSQTKRGRGQRRSRRMKNLSLDPAQKAARRYLRQEYSTYLPYAAQLADMTAYFREDRHGHRNAWSES